MIALATDTMTTDALIEPEIGLDALRLNELLTTAAQRRPRETAFVDQPGREAWSARPPIVWSYDSAFQIVKRLSGFFASLGLPHGSPVAICLPGGSEACLAILAVERAGLIPLLLPVAWPEEDLANAIESTGAAAVVTQTQVGPLRPAEAFCGIAGRYFGLRFLCAFGPHVPDGVVDLDRVMLDEWRSGGDPDQCEEAPLGLMTISARGGNLRPVFRPSRSAVAAGIAFLLSARFASGERILSLMAPDDHRSLTTGLVAALLSGACLECHGYFDGEALVESLARDVPTHLVAPGWMEPDLGAATLPASIRSIVLVHEAPVRFKARSSLVGRIVDVLGFDEFALVTRARGRAGQFAMTLDEGEQSPSTRLLLRVRNDESGEIFFGGPAAEIREVVRGIPAAGGPDWHATQFRAELFAGILIGVSETGYS